MRGAHALAPAAAAATPFDPYVAPRWLPGGHAQTIYASRLGVALPPLRRERVETADADFWDFDWLDPATGNDAPLVVLFHGLEGSVRSHYARALLARLHDRGQGGVVPHFRGCSGEPNRSARAYHSGDHEEIGALLAAVRARIAPSRALVAFGVSLGGSALLNWLGRAGAGGRAIVQAAAAVSAPIDLTAAGRAIGEGLNVVYTHHFLASLKPKSLALATRFPGRLDTHRIRTVRSMYAFDDAVTAPLHGFAGADDYWRRASSMPWLSRIDVPTLVLNARNDPFIPATSLPTARDVAPAVRLEQPDGGGHAGFPTGPFPGNVGWLPGRLLHFVDSGR